MKGEFKLEIKGEKRDILEAILNFHHQGYEGQAMILLAFYGLESRMHLDDLMWINKEMENK